MRMRFLALAVAAVAACALATSYGIYRGMPLAQETTVVIPPHQGVRGVLRTLRDAGAIPPLPVIALPLLTTPHLTSLKAGEYALSAGMTPHEILQKILRGEVVIHKLSIPEGWNRWQVEAAFSAEPLLSGPFPVTLTEGTLLPDTLHFTRDEPRSALVGRMQHAAQDWMRKHWPTRGDIAPIETPEQAIILASVVERETGLAEERPLVAAVFLNRLRKGMKLQSDPTVIYGLLQANQGQALGRPLGHYDLLVDSPYNTYTRSGLPVGPICNPGAAALEAVLHPAASDALYFVATGTGGHRFAATLDEHNQNVAAYRAALAAQKTATPSAPASGSAN